MYILIGSVIIATSILIGAWIISKRFEYIYCGELEGDLELIREAIDNHSLNQSPF